MKNIFSVILVLLGNILLYACNGDENSINLREENGNIKQEIMQLKIIIGNKTFLATMFDNSSMQAFIGMLPLTLDMIEFNGNEKYYNPKENEKLPVQNAKSGTINAGDLMVWDSDSRSLVLFYKTFESPYKYVRIAKINNPEGLERALGKGNVQLKFELEQ